MCEITFFPAVSVLRCTLTVVEESSGPQTAILFVENGRFYTRHTSAREKLAWANIIVVRLVMCRGLSIMKTGTECVWANFL